MLPQRHRLKRRSDVLRVRRRGRPYRHPLAILLVAAAGGEESGRQACQPSRFAFVASRRAGTAVARNRGKRLLREAVRLRLPAIEPGWDCLFIVREATAGADWRAVQTAVDNLLSRSHLLVER